MKFQINSLRELKEKQKLFVIETCLLGDPVLESTHLERNFFAEKFTTGMLGKNKQQIWDDWRRGADGRGKHPDGDLDVDIVGFWSASRTIGSVGLKGTVQRLNRRFLGRMDYAELFHHIGHEGMHKIGYFHGGRSFRKDVSYRMGDIMERSFEQYYEWTSYDKEELRGRAIIILKKINGGEKSFEDKTYNDLVNDIIAENNPLIKNFKLVA